MRAIYTPPRSRTADLPAIFVGALLLTLLVFLVLPLTQMVSGRRSSQLVVRSVDVAAPEKDSAKTDFQVTPQEQPTPTTEPPPLLSDVSAPPNLNFELDVAFGAGGALAVNRSFLNEITKHAASIDAIDADELEKKPEPLSRVPPVYPESMRKKKIEGVVTLLFVVDENGRVEDPRVESSTHKEFESAAVDAVRRWKFRPGYKDGQPVRTYLRQSVRFRLTSSK